MMKKCSIYKRRLRKALLGTRGCGNNDVCLKNLFGGLSGAKVPSKHGTFAPATPQVFFRAYINRRSKVLKPVEGFV
jgi:hypothetical protein